MSPPARLRARRVVRSRHTDLTNPVVVGLPPPAMVMPEPPMMVMPVPPPHLLDGSVLSHSGTDDIPVKWSSGCRRYSECGHGGESDQSHAQHGITSFIFRTRVGVLAFSQSSTLFGQD